jgi:hypothetical protein
MVEMQPGGSIERGDERVFAKLIIQEDVVEGQQTQENAISLPEAIRRFYRGFRGVESSDAAIKFEFFAYLFFLNTLSRGIAPFEGGTEERERGRIVRNWLRDKLSEALLANYDNIKNISNLKNAAGAIIGEGRKNIEDIIGEGRKNIEDFLSRRGEIKVKINWAEFKRLFTSRTGIELNNFQIEGIGNVTEDEIKRHLGIVTENGDSYLYVNPVTINFGGVLAGETTGERLQQIRENLVNRLTDENLLTRLAIAPPTPEGPTPPTPEGPTPPTPEGPTPPTPEGPTPPTPEGPTPPTPEGPTPTLEAQVLEEYNRILGEVAKIQRALKEIKSRELSERSKREYDHLLLILNQLFGFLDDIKTDIQRALETGNQAQLNAILQRLRDQTPRFQALANCLESLLNFQDPKKEEKLKEAVKIGTNIISFVALGLAAGALPFLAIFFGSIAGILAAMDYLEKKMGIKQQKG